MERSKDTKDIGRVIRPGDGGVILSDRHFKLEDINELTDALIEKSHGRLNDLQEAARVIQTRLKRQVDTGRARIEDAMKVAQSEIQTRLDDTAELTERVYRERYEEGLEKGHREGLEKGTAEGYEQGFKDGYSTGEEKGINEGREAGRTAIEEEMADEYRKSTDAAIASVRTLSTELRGEWMESLNAARESLLDLSLRLAEAVIKERIEEAPELVCGTLERALEKIEAEALIVVDIHPKDRSVIEQFLADRLDQLLDDTTIQIRENESIERGGLVVRGNHTVVEATISGQIETMRERLREAGGIL